MKTPSTELVHIPKPPIQESGAFAQMFGELSTTVSRSIDLTGVYNEHKSAYDAEVSMALIPNNSLVFMEGFTENRGNFEMTHVATILEGLSQIHLNYGLDSEEYRNAKTDIQLTFATVGYEKDDGTFLENYITQAQLLVEKDCVVYAADATGLFPNKDNNQEPDVSAYVNPLNTDKWSVSKFAKVAEWRSQSQYILDTQREKHAAISTVLKTSELLESYPDNDLVKTPEGKLKAFILYGRDHRDSMTATFQERGINLTPITIGKPNYRLIPRDYPTFLNDFPRQVAIATISNLSFKAMLQYEEMDEFLAVSHEGLDILNKDPETYKKFMIRAAQIHYLLFAAAHEGKDSDKTSARQQLLNFLTETPGCRGDMLVDEESPATFATNSDGVTTPLV